MESLKTNCYRQRSWSRNEQAAKNNCDRSGSMTQYNNNNKHYIQKDMSEESHQLEVSLNDLRFSGNNGNMSIIQNFQIGTMTLDMNTMTQNQNNLKDSVHLELSNVDNLILKQQQTYTQLDSAQFCMNFMKFLKSKEAEKWIEMSRVLDELNTMIQIQVDPQSIYDKLMKISELLSIKDQFIPKKFDILTTCLKQLLSNLCELCLETTFENDQEHEQQSIQNDSNIYQFKKPTMNQINKNWKVQVDIIVKQYFKIFSRHIQQFHQLGSNRLLPNPKRTLLSKLNESKNISDKENIPQKQQQTELLSFEEQKQLQRIQILEKYSTENTLLLKIQQLEKQIKQIQSSLQAKTKELDICRIEKTRIAVKLSEIELKFADQEKNLLLADPQRFNSLRTGEAEYLIKRHELEKNELKRIIQLKDQEIQSYRIELEGILSEIEFTSRQKIENSHRNNLN